MKPAKNLSAFEIVSGMLIDAGNGRSGFVKSTGMGASRWLVDIEFYSGICVTLDAASLVSVLDQDFANA